MSTDLVSNTEEWMEQAVCRETDPEAFFPESCQVTPKLVKKVCLDCPVRLNCLAYAIRENERFGIWGGMARGERDLVKRAIDRRGGDMSALASVVEKMSQRSIKERRAEDAAIRGVRVQL